MKGQINSWQLQEIGRGCALQGFPPLFILSSDQAAEFPLSFKILK